MFKKAKTGMSASRRNSEKTDNMSIGHNSDLIGEKMSPKLYENNVLRLSKNSRNYSRGRNESSGHRSID